MDKTEHQLPFEILQQIFSHLQKKSGILQCQLTCQQWYLVATEKLYESVTVNYEPRATAFIRVITRSPELGKLVKVVNVGWLFNRTINKKGSLFTWDTQDLLTLILKSCPNIVQFQAVSPDKIFWVRLVCAFVNGELQFLESIPNPDYDNIESYVHTALTFRQTLKELVVCDQTSYQSPTGKEIDFRSYEVLLRRLKDFPNLNKLKILHHTNDSLLEFDSVIQDCPKLKTLDIAIYPQVHLDNTPNSSDISTLSSFQPSPDIKDVSGIWEIMDGNNALKYFMHKFPKLDKMVFRFRSRPDLHPALPYNISAEDAIAFFKYVSNIPSLYVQCAFKADNLIDIWAEYMKSTEFQGGVGIDYGFRNTSGSQKMLLSKSPSCTNPDFTTTLNFDADDRATELPHKELIEKVEHLVQKLQISGVHDMQTYFETREDNEYTYDMVNGYWLDDILQKCPLVKDIAIYHPGSIKLYNSITETYGSVQKLFISKLFATEESNPILTDLSTRLPALTHLHLYYYEEESKNVTTINMPHTHFDKLIWDKSTTVTDIFKEDWKFYLKVTTPTIGETFIVGDRYNIYPSSEKHYNDSLRDPEPLSFDIRCKRIDVFWIKFLHVVDKQHNLYIN